VKIQCNNCKAIYNIDAARIPPNGATSTCKKCQAKIVINPSTDEAGIQLEARPVEIASAPPSHDQPDRADSIKKIRDKAVGRINDAANLAEKIVKKADSLQGIEQIRTHLNSEAKPQIAKMIKARKNLIRGVGGFIGLLLVFSIGWFLLRSDKSSFEPKTVPTGSPSKQASTQTLPDRKDTATNKTEKMSKADQNVGRAAHVEALTIKDTKDGEESTTVLTDKGQYIVPWPVSGMIDEKTFDQLANLIENGKGKSFPFIIQQDGDLKFIVGIKSDKKENASAGGSSTSQPKQPEKKAAVWDKASWGMTVAQIQNLYPEAKIEDNRGKIESSKIAGIDFGVIFYFDKNQTLNSIKLDAKEISEFEELNKLFTILTEKYGESNREKINIRNPMNRAPMEGEKVTWIKGETKIVFEYVRGVNPLLNPNNPLVASMGDKAYTTIASIAYTLLPKAVTSNEGADKL
jgi:predicted Zn finger-like uncharacterized protein